MASDFPVVFALYPDVTQLDFTGHRRDSFGGCRSIIARLSQNR